MVFRPIRVKFQVSIVAAILATIILMTLSSLGVVLWTGDTAARNNARTLFSTLAESVGRHAESLLQENVRLASISAQVSSNPAAGSDAALTSLFKTILTLNPDLYSGYVGRQDGSFLQIIAVRGDQRILEAHQAPRETVQIGRTIRGSGALRRQTWAFWGPGDILLETRTDQQVSFDPRERPWYQAAWEHPEGVLSEPYAFYSLQEPGLTASAPLTGRTGVLGLDVTLRGLQAFLRRFPVSPQGGLLVRDAHQTILAQTPGFRLDSHSLVLTSPRTIANQKWEIVLTAPIEDFTGHFRSMQTQVLLWTGFLVLVFLPLSFLFSRHLATLIRALTQDVERIWRLDFGGEIPSGSVVQEFNLLTQRFSMMKETLSARTLALDDAKLKLKRIVELANDLSAEKDINRLTELILQGAKELTLADGGSLYLVDKERKNLLFQIVLNDSLGFKQGGTSGQKVTMPPVPLYKADGSENLNNVVSTAFLRQEIVNIPDAYDEHDQFDFSGTRRFDEANGYRSKSFLTIPLMPRGGDVIGALQLINAKNPVEGEEAVGVFTQEMEEYVSALTALAAAALYNRDLLESQKALFEAVIQLIAGAIDTKSPYTGGHCARVPVIAMMLADAVSQAKEGPLAGFSFRDDEERREFRIAAWLHDAGKVTTPEYVVDKATKLETIYNRIHEIRTRFEVLLRDARIQRLETLLAGGDPEKADQVLAKEEDRLKEDFAFLAQANLGQEFIDPEQVKRIHELAQRTWLRHFDDRLGLSWEELQRTSREPVRALPATETLLADKALHLFPRSPEFHELYNGYDFRIPIPENLYHQGEVYNLTIGRGTLTAEERFKINEHVMQTIVMLDKLPLPEGLRRVPEIAGQHHETLVGTGYPRMLTGNDLSLSSRILTLADIFEALSASDRPYKKPKTLSECIKVLALFKKDKHIDADLFDLFLTSGVYHEYAQKYLKPHQIDSVDIAQYLG